MLLNSSVVGSAIEILRDEASDTFYVPAHQYIYAAVIELFHRNLPVDVVTLLEQLKKDGHYDDCGGASYIAELTSAVPTSANIEHYARIVLDAAILRKLITNCTQIAGSAYEGGDDVTAILDRAEASIFSISQKRQTNPIRRVGDLVPDAVERIESLIHSHSGITGLPTGLTELDKLLSGLQPSDMVILAARPSVGKTALALNIASHAAIELKKGVLMFSLEMSQEQLTQRLLCREGKIDSKRLRDGFLAKNEMAKLIPAADRVFPAPLYIDDTPNIPMFELRSKARRHMAQHEISLIIIDYLQLMSSPRRVENRQVEISEISRNIKGLARELRVPVLALSQLSREAEKDDSGVPKLSHLRESGSIEQDADVVLMLWRPPGHERHQDDEQIKLSVAKHRNGPTGIIDLMYRRNIQRFENLAREAVDAPPDGPAYEEDYI